MVIGLLITSTVSGSLVGRTGRYKIYPVAGTAIMLVGFVLLSRMNAATPIPLQSLYLLILGAGIGMCMQVLVLIVQNTSDFADLGVATSGVTDFPIDSIPLATWTATVGAWDGIGYLDFRAFQSIKNIVPGTGLLTVESSGTTMVEVDRALVGVRVTAPSTPGSACVSGSWAADSDYLYVCYGTNQWKRSALASW